MPPASKLPPPKLTSHSLALLNVFKDEKRTPKTPKATLASGLETAPVGGGRKPSQHQDQLLSLLKGSPGPPAPGPVELSAHSVSPSQKHILHRPRDNNRPKEPATTPAPSTFAAKPPAKKSQNGSNRKSNKERKSQSSQNVASPITILPRPQNAKREPTPTPAAAAAAAPSSRNSSGSRRERKTRTPEPSKPFQPQILRRTENLDNVLPVRTKGTPNPEQSVPSQDAKLPEDHGRRPSQNVSQRETLLSLFGKAGASSPGLSPSGQLNLKTAVAQGSGGSSVVSPLSPLNLPSGTTTNTGAPSLDINTSRVSSPDNKAFLLGFLEGVAKGNK